MDLQDWFDAFRRQVRRNPWADGLREAALTGVLGRWTALLTDVVAKVCEELGFRVAARGQTSRILPISRQEYLGLDVLAFPAGESSWWVRPVMAFELENRTRVASIAYALWKVCMVRVAWGGVFCYRKDPDQIGELLRILTEVVRAVTPSMDLLVVVGTRCRAEDFPDGFFRAYRWDEDYQRFRLLLS
jgi:hypothetical protein|uniref:Uncharacterized protein n=1 Tax=Thermomicrobium roseum TaxID=500 RepID=A0A7C2B869_THERO